MQFQQESKVKYPKTSAVGQTQAQFDSFLQVEGMPPEPVREPGFDGFYDDLHRKDSQTIEAKLQDVNQEADDFLTGFHENPEEYLGWLASTTGRAH
jgi:hypothetical protein